MSTIQIQQQEDSGVFDIISKTHMKRTDQALTLFHGKDHLNCAQSIALAFGSGSTLKKDFQNFGGGRAPENTCGAVYAGIQLLNNTQQQIFKEAFLKKTSSLKCRELKQQGTFSCRECVRIAAEILDEIL